MSKFIITDSGSLLVIQGYELNGYSLLLISLYFPHSYSITINKKFKILMDVI